MREAKETTSDGDDIRVTTLPARSGAKLLAKVGKALAPSLMKLSGEDVSDALSTLFNSLDDASIDALLSDVFKHTTIVPPDKSMVFDLSKGDVVDKVFTGQLPLMFKVFKFALEVNFGPFFDGNGIFAAVLAGGNPSPST